MKDYVSWLYHRRKDNWYFGFCVSNGVKCSIFFETLYSQWFKTFNSFMKIQPIYGKHIIQNTRGPVVLTASFVTAMILGSRKFWKKVSKSTKPNFEKVRNWMLNLYRISSIFPFFFLNDGTCMLPILPNVTLHGVQTLNRIQNKILK